MVSVVVIRFDSIRAVFIDRKYLNWFSVTPLSSICQRRTNEPNTPIRMSGVLCSITLGMISLCVCVFGKTTMDVDFIRLKEI